MQHNNQPSFKDMEQKYPFFKLMRPVGGVVQQPMPLTQGELGIPDFKIFSSALGHLTMTAPHIVSGSGEIVTSGSIGGAGSDETKELALVRSVAEAAERYANCMLNDSASYITATKRELGDAAMDLDTLPICSEKEYANPKMPLSRPDIDAPMRWIKSYSLTEDREVYVPAILTYLYVNATPGENFVYPISTGVSIYSNLLTAVLSGICEVVERDAIALSWLAKLQLPKIEFDAPPPAHLKDKLKQQQAGQVQQLFFDATSDIGIPTIYSVQLVEGHPSLSQFVSCSTDFNAHEAAAKVIRESATGRTMFEYPRNIPENFEDFLQLEEGAAYMGRPEQRKHFDFLLNSNKTVPISAMQGAYPSTDSGKLKWLKKRFTDLGMKVYVTEITTDELQEVGLRAVRVIIPELMPMTPVYRARFLAHKRLYDYPLKAGFGAVTEDTLNHAPQPFA